MTAADFDALLARRDDIERQHGIACAILEEEGPGRTGERYRRCTRLYDQLAAVQEQIDAELAAERATEEASP